MALENASDRMKKLELQKKLHTLQKELKQGEQNQFFDNLRLEQDMEGQIKALMESAELAAKVERLFVVKVKQVGSEKRDV